MFEFLGCHIEVPPQQMSAIVRTESAANQYAIGVVGHHLSRQPSSEAEAQEVIQMLKANGHNFSVGLAQVNKINFGTFLSHNDLFDKCSNLLAGSRILKVCYQQYQDWQKAYSCYYSGNPVTGFRHGYVQKVSQNLKKPILKSITSTSKVSTIKEIDTPIVLHENKKNTKNKKLIAASSPKPTLSQRRLSASLSTTRGIYEKTYEVYK